MSDAEQWYKIAFTEEEVEEGAPGRVEKRYQQFYAAAHSPKDAALFANELAAEGIEYFFSPDASQLAQALLTEYSAVPCDPPDLDDVRLALGHRGVSERLLSHRTEV
jgi:hypothetical protein